MVSTFIQTHSAVASQTPHRAFRNLKCISRPFERIWTPPGAFNAIHQCFQYISQRIWALFRALGIFRNAFGRCSGLLAYFATHLTPFETHLTLFGAYLILLWRINAFWDAWRLLSLFMACKAMFFHLIRVFWQQDVITAFITSVSHETFVSVTCVLTDHRGAFSPFAFVIAHFYIFYILFVARFYLFMRLCRRVCFLSGGACICSFCDISSSDCARDAVFRAICAFCSAFYVFLWCVYLFAVRFASFCGVFAFLRHVRLFAVHCTVFSVLLMIFFCAPHSFGGAGTGTTRRRNIFLYLFRRFIDKQKV